MLLYVYLSDFNIVYRTRKTKTWMHLKQYFVEGSVSSVDFCLKKDGWGDFKLLQDMLQCSFFLSTSMLCILFKVTFVRPYIIKLWPLF